MKITHRLIRILATTTLALAIASPGNAQDVRKADIRGIIVNSSDEGLESATVMLLHAVDSVLASFAITNMEGVFEIRNARAGDYLLKLSYIGFAPQTTQLTIGESEQVDLGKITLQEASELLSEVEITADFIPIQVKKDTIEYNADAFKTQPNANVEELLKKLPGVEVDTDGKIKAQGEDVNKVLVDGKEFFGDDPKMATKNLPADAVNKVQVYDKLSDMAEFSGIDDGDREKTINLQLREDRKKGMFGTLTGGYGSDDRYMGKANINKFTKASQLSLLAQLNNVNDQGFSFDEYVSFSGGMRSLMGRSDGGRVSIGGDVPISDGLSDGLVKTLAGGVNYNVEVGKKLDLRSSYFYNGVENTLLQDRFRENFGDMNPFETDDDIEQITENRGHRVNLIAEYAIDTTQNVELRSNASFGHGEFDKMQLTNAYLPPDYTQSLTTDIGDNDNTRFSGDLYYRKRFGARRGRTLTANVSLDANDGDGMSLLESLNEYLATGDSEYLNQRQNNVDDEMDWGARLSYTEPIGKNKWLELNFRYQDDHSEAVQDVYDLDTLSGDQVFNPELSTNFERNYTYRQGGMTFRMNGLKSSLSIGLQYQDSDLQGLIEQQESPIERTYGQLLPNLRYRYEFATARSMRFDYRTSIRMPSINQLSPIVDNSDPLRVYVGNPDLEPEYTHRVNLHFHSFSQFSFTSIFAMISGTLTEDRIVTSSFIDENFVETQKPVNIDQDWSLSAYTAFGTPLRFLKNRLELRANATYNQSKLLINDALTDVDRWNERFGLSFRSQNSEVLEYDIGANWTISNTIYEDAVRKDQDFFTHHYYADVTVNFLKSWKINTSYDYRLYTGDQFADNQTLPLWKASISKYILEGKRGEIRLSVFDVLDENRGISRNSEENYIEEIRSNSIGRYVMMSFIYSIKGFNPDEGSSMRFIHRRGR